MATAAAAPPRRTLKATTRELLAKFPASAEEVDLRDALGSLSDAALWEGACALAEDAANADVGRFESTGVPGPPTGGVVADWCEDFLANTQGGLRQTDGCDWAYERPGVNQSGRRRRRGCDVDIPWSGRESKRAAAAPRGYSV